MVPKDIFASQCARVRASGMVSVLSGNGVKRPERARESRREREREKFGGGREFIRNDTPCACQRTHNRTMTRRQLLPIKAPTKAPFLLLLVVYTRSVTTDQLPLFYFGGRPHSNPECTQASRHTKAGHRWRIAGMSKAVNIIIKEFSLEYRSSSTPFLSLSPSLSLSHSLTHSHTLTHTRTRHARSFDCTSPTRKQAAGDFVPCQMAT
jgi:hypothetical protein